MPQLTLIPKVVFLCQYRLLYWMYTIVHGMHLPNEQHCIAILANMIDMSSFMHEMPCLIYSLTPIHISWCKMNVNRREYFS